MRASRRMSDEGQRAQRAGRQVSAEFRGEVCVVRWGSGSADDLAGDLRAELEFCRVSGAADIVLDVDPNVTLGWEELSVLQEAAESVHREGGEFVAVSYTHLRAHETGRNLV